MQDVLRRQQERAAFNVHAAILVALGGGASCDPDGRIQAQRLGENLFGERQMRIVRSRGRAALQNSFAVGGERVLNLRMPRQQPQGKAQRVGCGLMPGQHYGHALIAHLPIAHAGRC